MEVFNCRNYVGLSLLLLAVAVIEDVCRWSIACVPFVYDLDFAFGYWTLTILIQLWAIFTVIMAFKTFFGNCCKANEEKIEVKKKAKRK